MPVFEAIDEYHYNFLLRVMNYKRVTIRESTINGYENK